MPNWCTNNMRVEGNPEDLAFFKQTMNVPDKHGDVKALSEEPLIPYPEEFKEMDRTYKERQAKWEEISKEAGFGKMTEQQRNRFLKNHPYVRDGYNSGGYEWEQANYGTKWGFGEVEILDGGDSFIDYMFDTAWAPPEGLYKLLGNKFPNLTFKIDYEEPGMDFAGTYFIEGDNVNHEDRPVLQRCSECGEGLDECSCERCPDCKKLIDIGDDTSPDLVCNCEERKKKEEEIERWQERWHKRSYKMPNLDYNILNKGIKK